MIQPASWMRGTLRPRRRRHALNLCVRSCSLLIFSTSRTTTEKASQRNAGSKHQCRRSLADGSHGSRPIEWCGFHCVGLGVFDFLPLPMAGCASRCEILVRGHTCCGEGVGRKQSRSAPGGRLATGQSQ